MHVMHVTQLIILLGCLQATINAYKTCDTDFGPDGGCGHGTCQGDRCSCYSGWGNGHDGCFEENRCITRPPTCRNGEIMECIDGDGVCSCPAGFTGTNCKTPQVCGGRLTANSGLITSPRFPRHYANNQDCVWVVAVTPPGRIRFQFGAIRLEMHYDYLEIKDGDNEAADILQTYCCASNPEPLVTTGPYAFVRFHSDWSNSDTGFNISYTTVTGCDANHYGQECSQTCSCVEANTADCDDNDGYCTCKYGWTGRHCDVHIVFTYPTTATTPTTTQRPIPFACETGPNAVVDYVYQYDPAQYIHCASNGKAYIQTCPFGKLWNQAVRRCEAPSLSIG